MPWKTDNFCMLKTISSSGFGQVKVDTKAIKKRSDCSVICDSYEEAHYKDGGAAHHERQ